VSEDPGTVEDVPDLDSVVTVALTAFSQDSSYLVAMAESAVAINSRAAEAPQPAEPYQEA
jgi:hypothetical protein